MPDFLTFSVSASQQAEILRLLDGITFRGTAAGKVAMQAAISRTVTRGRALVAREIVKAVRLKVGDVKKLIAVKRGSYDKPQGTITITRGAVSLSRFLSPAQQQRYLKRREGTATQKTSPALRVSVRKRPSGPYGTTERIPEGFVGRARISSSAQIFKRKGKKRLPIEKLQGPTAIGVLAHAAGEEHSTIIADVEADLIETLEKNLLSQIDRFTARRGVR